jgi:hypothetical protein
VLTDSIERRPSERPAVDENLACGRSVESEQPKADSRLRTGWPRRPNCLSRRPHWVVSKA